MFSRIHHVAVIVRSADEALRFYRDALGLPVTKDAVIEDQGVRGVLLQAGKGEIELIEPVREGTGVARFLETKGEGLHHVCLESDNVGAELDAARAKGLALIDQAPRRGLAGMIGFLHPRATRGVLVEYATPVDEGGSAHPDHGAGAEGSRFDHVAIVVTDLDAGIATWRDNFGLSAASVEEVSSFGIKAATMPLGSAAVELIAPMSDVGPVAAFLREKGEGMYLVSLAVRQLSDTVDALRRRTIEVSGIMPGPGGAGLAIVSPESANGVLIQLIERSAT